MIEVIVKDFLKEKLNIPVLMEIPSNPPEEYIVIEKVGGGSKNHIYRSMIAIDSYGKSMFRAAQLNDEVKQMMEKIIEVDDVSRVDLNSDHNHTDKVNKKYRYQAVFELVHY